MTVFALSMPILAEEKAPALKQVVQMEIMNQDIWRGVDANGNNEADIKLNYQVVYKEQLSVELELSKALALGNSEVNDWHWGDELSSSLYWRYQYKNQLLRPKIAYFRYLAAEPGDTGSAGLETSLLYQIVREKTDYSLLWLYDWQVLQRGTYYKLRADWNWLSQTKGLDYALRLTYAHHEEFLKQHDHDFIQKVFTGNPEVFKSLLPTVVSLTLKERYNLPRLNVDYFLKQGLSLQLANTLNRDRLEFVFAAGLVKEL